MFVQIKGYKKWTFFEPSQLGDLCFYPYAHPSARQVQADMGEGVGARCLAYEKLHNRTVIMGESCLIFIIFSISLLSLLMPTFLSLGVGAPYRFGCLP
jgi:hypothetical protein